MRFLSLLWALVVFLRNKFFDKGVLPSRSFPLPVICVGNLSVGGTGKTPHTEYILRLLHDNGYHVAMLSRGYGRKTKGYVLADRSMHTACEIGDEPYQMLYNCPFATIAVCEKRVVGIERLLQDVPMIDVIVLDDAYQHRYVSPSLSILLTDASRPYSTDHLLPWGRLREPASAAKRAQIVVLTKCNNIPTLPDLPLSTEQCLYHSFITYADCNHWQYDKLKIQANEWKRKRVLLITGIARPEPLCKYLEKQGAMVEMLSFPDHHSFTTQDITKINTTFAQSKADYAITTQKDITRLYLHSSQLSENLKCRLYVQPITVELRTTTPKETSFNHKILDHVSKYPRHFHTDGTN